MATTETQTLTLTHPPALLEAIAQRAAELVLHQLEPTHGQTSAYLTIVEAAAYARCKRQRIDDLLSAHPRLRTPLAAIRPHAKSYAANTAVSRGASS